MWGLVRMTRLASWGDTDGSCLQGQNSRVCGDLSSLWWIPYISVLNVCPSVTWKFPLLPYHSLWTKHLSMCFTFQLRKGRKMGRWRWVKDTEGWLTLSQGGQLKMLSCVPVPFSRLWEPLPFLVHPSLGGMAPKRLDRERSQPWQRLLISSVLPKGSHSEQADFFLPLICLCCLSLQSKSEVKVSSASPPPSCLFPISFGTLLTSPALPKENH